jgi:hypothetical protein
MDWKQALGIEDPRWLGIGKHLAEIVRENLEKKGYRAEDLTNYLRQQRNNHIRLSYVEEYLSGKASFGCFFPLLRNFLDISPGQIFKNSQDRGAEEYLKSLDDYLTDSNNPEALVISLKYKPGKELRDFVRTTLSSKREETLRNKAFYSMEVGPDSKENAKEVYNLIKNYVVGAKGKELKCLPENIELATSIISTQASAEVLYKNIIERTPKPSEDKFSDFGMAEFHKMFEGSSIRIQPTLNRGKIGFTVDFFSLGDLFDNYVAARSEVSVDAWREAYREGTFSKVDTKSSYGYDTPVTQKIENMANCVDSGLLSLVQVREPTEAQRYEAHRRWRGQGGWSMPGPRMPGSGPAPSNTKPAFEDVPNPRSEFEETIYNVESSFGIILPLSNLLPELVLDKPMLNAETQ